MTRPHLERLARTLLKNWNSAHSVTITEDDTYITAIDPSRPGGANYTVSATFAYLIVLHQESTPMVFQRVPEKKYRLHDGSLGTEYAALRESIQVWRHKLQEAEDMLEELHRRLPLAEGYEEHFHGA